jgi:hypothetical protein
VPWAPAGRVTGTVGLSKVVVMLYTGIGLLGFVLHERERLAGDDIMFQSRIVLTCQRSRHRSQTGDGSVLTGSQR